MEREEEIKKAFSGKTIVDVECRSLNAWTFIFNDGSKISIDTACFDTGIYGPVVLKTPLEETQEVKLRRYNVTVGLETVLKRIVTVTAKNPDDAWKKATNKANKELSSNPFKTWDVSPSSRMEDAECLDVKEVDET